MDGALFVDDDRAPRKDDERRPARRAPSPSRGHDDGKAEDARRITQGILDRMDLEARVHVREDDEQVVLDIDGPDAGRAIGKKGMTLEALQFLVNKIVNREPDERRHIVLDSGDYRERHDNGLVSMAKREAKRAVTSGRAVTLEPMSARDRRVIHVALAKMPGISTRSEGEGMERRLQIIPARGGDRERSRDDRDRPARDDRDRPARDDRGERSARDDRDRPREDRPREARDDRPREARDDRPREARDDRPREARDDRPREARDERSTRDDRAPRDDRPAPREERGGRDGLVERARDDRARSTRDDRARRSDRPAPERAREPAREPARSDDRPREYNDAPRDDDRYRGR